MNDLKKNIYDEKSYGTPIPAIPIITSIAGEVVLSEYSSVITKQKFI